VNQEKDTPYENFEDFLDAFMGTFWVLQAIVHDAINNGFVNTDSYKDDPYLYDILKLYDDRLAEIEPGYRGLNKGSDENNDLPEASIKRWFLEIIGYHFSAKEKLSKGEIDIVMVAGKQGVGKSIVVEHFVEHGYQLLSMSNIVREVSASWDLDKNQTIDKIVAGQVLKEYFGPEILVYLGIENLLVYENAKKIVIDGPRLVEEAQVVRDIGGKLIAVIADEDPEIDTEIRRDRIKKRASEYIEREGDLEKFYEREAIEGGKIDEILALVPEEQIFINNGNIKTLKKLLDVILFL
jgi:dephospho-CoA kinase